MMQYERVDRCSLATTKAELEECLWSIRNAQREGEQRLHELLDFLTNVTVYPIFCEVEDRLATVRMWLRDLDDRKVSLLRRLADVQAPQSKTPPGG